MMGREVVIEDNTGAMKKEGEEITLANDTSHENGCDKCHLPWDRSQSML